MTTLPKCFKSTARSQATQTLVEEAFLTTLTPIPLKKLHSSSTNFNNQCNAKFSPISRTNSGRPATSLNPNSSPSTHKKKMQRKMTMNDTDFSNLGTVRLINVDGDQEDFADLIGTEGKIHPTSEGLTFMPNNRGDWLSMRPKRKTWKDGKVKISTTLGNTFTFRVINDA